MSLQMPTIGLDIEGELSLKRLAEAASRLVRILDAVDREVLNRPRVSFDWVITGLESGSAHLTAAPRLLKNQQVPVNAAAMVVSTVYEGISSIRAGGPRPRSFPDSAVDEVLGLVELLEVEGIESIAIRADGKVVDVSKAIRTQLATEAAQKEASLGSVEGVIETLTIHGQNYFNLYDDLTGNAVKCYFADEQLEDVHAAFGKRVMVWGTMYTLPSGVRDNIRVREMHVFGDEVDLPRAGDVRGILRKKNA